VKKRDRLRFLGARGKEKKRNGATQRCMNHRRGWQRATCPLLLCRNRWTNEKETAYISRLLEEGKEQGDATHISVPMIGRKEEKKREITRSRSEGGGERIVGHSSALSVKRGRKRIWFSPCAPVRKKGEEKSVSMQFRTRGK